MTVMLAARRERQVIASTPRRKPARRSAGLLERGFGMALRNPGGIIAALLLSSATGAILTNALLNQPKPHPAPLFAERGDPLWEQRRPVAEVSPAPLPPVRMPVAPAAMQRPAASTVEPAAAPIRAPSARDAIGDLIRTGETGATTATQASIRTAPAPRPSATREPIQDPIADIIRTGEPATSAIMPPADLSGRVAAAQRALVRLGYGALETDGLLGPATRQAIERFERDRKLPVTGELNQRTARALAERAGISIE